MIKPLLVGFITCLSFLVLLRTEVRAEACTSDIIGPQLTAQRDALLGDPRQLNDLVNTFNRAQIGILESEDQYIYLCNTTFFSVARVSYLIDDLLGSIDIGNTSADASTRRVKYVKEILSVYDELLFLYMDSGAQRDSIYNDIRIVRNAAFEFALSITDTHDDSIFRSFNDPMNSTRVYRVFYGSEGDLNLYEAVFHLGTKEIQEFDQRMSKLISFNSVGIGYDGLTVPAQFKDNWLDWGQRNGVRIYIGDGQEYVLDMAGLVSIVLSWDGRRNRSQISSGVDAIRTAVSALAARPFYNSSSTIRRTNDTSHDLETDTNAGEIGPGTCIVYRTPADNDLFIHFRPTTFGSEPIKANATRSASMFRVVGDLIPVPGDLALVEYQGKRYHTGQTVREWVPVEYQGRTFYMIYSKDTQNEDAYIRFKKVEC